jgi:hypothetical protein
MSRTGQAADAHGTSGGPVTVQPLPQTVDYATAHGATPSVRRMNPGVTEWINDNRNGVRIFMFQVLGLKKWVSI